jgi:hypothetical protein
MHTQVMIITPNRWSCNNWALWKELDPEAMPRILPQVCEDHLPIQDRHGILNLRNNTAYICVLH